MQNIQNIQKMAEENEIKISGLDNIPHIVQGRPLFDMNGVDKEILNNFLPGEENGIWAGKGKMNIAIFPDGRVEDLRIVSDQYQVVQHGQALWHLMNALPEKFDLKSVDITVSPNGGKCNAKLTSGHELDLGKGDKVNYQLLMQNSGDASKRLSLMGGAWRLVCSNGMVIPDNRVEQVSTKKLHTGKLSLDSEIISFLDTVEQSIGSMDIWKDYLKKSLSAPDLESVFTALEVGPRIQEEILELGLRGENTSVQNELTNKRLTAWNLYNAFTQRITDSEASESVKLEKGTKISQYFDDLVTIH